MRLLIPHRASLSDETIKVKVGPDHVPFTIHKRLLEQSGFFKDTFLVQGEYND